MLDLTLTTLEDKNNSFLLTLVTKRLAEAPEEEYVPNAMTCEFLIYNQTNELVWQSSYEKKYTMVVGKVLPTEVGAEYSCGEFFLGEGNVRKGVLSAGVYHVVARIPSSPKEYTATTDIILK